MIHPEDMECPFCKAKAGEKCVTINGDKRKWPHALRIKGFWLQIKKNIEERKKRK